MKRPTVGFLYSDIFLEHTPPSGHPERADRLRAITNHLHNCGLFDQLSHINPTPARKEHILVVHSKSHHDLVKKTCESGGGLLDDGDTHAVRKSYDVAMLASGAVLNAIDAIVAKAVSSVFCAVRPPGHHAERDAPMGFCLFNSVAVGARYAQQKHGMSRIAILDWDVHHGNGTQHVFEEDPTVFYCSLHQYPFYPGTGAKNERGKGDGKGFTLNIPLPAGTGEERYISALKEEVVPALKKFSPDLLIISAGFDAHRDDPLGGMKLTETSFAKMTEAVKGIAPIVSVLEGGYNLNALARSVENHLRELAEEA